MLSAKQFLWGAATSAHQVEGGNTNDWTEWEALGRVARGERSGLAADHYRRYREDIALAAELGHTAHRFSIEWSRVEPREGEWDEAAIAHYRDVVATLRAQHMEPVVTLHHFTNPTWIAERGGWASERTVDAFCRYVERMAAELPDLRYWITINEPTVYALLGHFAGYWPPEKRSLWSAIRVLNNFAEAHRRAHAIIHRVTKNALVGAANNIVDYAPARPAHPLDKLLTSLARRFSNDWWLQRTIATQDFIGLNYYFFHALRFRFATPRAIWAPAPQPGLPASDVGWAIHPAGFGRVLRRLGRYGKPIIVTENGVADAQDTYRADFLRDHIAEMQNAMKDGVDVRGYLHWSLLDNFEWREGFAPRFGLVAVDYPTQERRPRPSAYVFRDIIKNHS